MKIHFYNSLGKKIQEFKPLKNQQVGIYACGPTVYDFAHLGNFRTYIFVDLLSRFFEYLKFDSKLVINITDVGHLVSDADTGVDKVAQKAQENRKTAWEIAKFFEEAFWSDAKLLNIQKPKFTPLATDHIQDMIDLIKILEQKGFTYKTSDGIYFDTIKLKDYGKLIKIESQNLVKRRIEKKLGKKNSFDFALWKFSTTNVYRDMEWESPWGKGFPGWHIECSAMSKKYLGQPFDIHIGGTDHLPIHHNNEIAQSEAAFEKPLANYWLHCEHMLVDGQKMSKSLGNFILLKDIVKKGFSPFDFRFYVLQNHYRSQMNFTWEGLEQAKITLANIRKNIFSNHDQLSNGDKNNIIEIMANDMNFPKAIEKLNVQKNVGLWLKFDQIFGLNLQKETKELTDIQKKLIQDREEARGKNDFAKADEIRKELQKQGIQISDAKDGSKIEYIE